MRYLKTIYLYAMADSFTFFKAPPGYTWTQNVGVPV